MAVPFASASPPFGNHTRRRTVKSFAGGFRIFGRRELEILRLRQAGVLMMITKKLVEPPPTLSKPNGRFWSHFAAYRIADVIAVELTFDRRPPQGSEDIEKSDFFVPFLCAQ